MTRSHILDHDLVTVILSLFKFIYEAPFPFSDVGPENLASIVFNAGMQHTFYKFILGKNDLSIPRI